jgi:hypothetical protein
MIKINECFKNAQEFPPSTLKNAGDFYDEVFDMFEHPEKFNSLWPRKAFN